MPLPDVSPDTVFDVAIIGGGASGVMVAIHLLNASPGPLRLAIIEPRSSLGHGAAYSTAFPEHLLNVIAARMSLFDADNGHFARFLQAEGAAPGIEATFVPRRDFGRYLRATLDAQRGADRLRYVHGVAVDVMPGTPNQVVLGSGEVLLTRRIVLAVGNTARPLPVPASAVTGKPGIVEAWDYAAIRAIDAEADVCVLGSGLSMVDAVVSLAAIGHRGRLSVVSRHGMMPLPHSRPGEQDGTVDELLALGLRERMRAIRLRAAEAMRAGEPWQWTMDRLRHHVQALWTSLSDTDQRRFLRHVARAWDIHRHRIAPAADECLTRLQRAGRLQVVAGRVSSISGEDRAVVVRPRGRAEDRSIPADVVINATGVESNIVRMRSPLVRSLADRGLIRPGNHGIGIDTDASGAVIGIDCIVLDDFFALGAMRIGSLWESIAIPELRGQAQRIAERLLASLSTRV